MKSNLLVLCLILISFSTAILNTHVESGTRTRFTNVVFYDGDVKIHGKPLIRSNVNVFISLSSLLLYQGREEDFNEDDLNSRSFIIKRYELSSIDLSCGGFMFICSLKELKSEFEKSYKSINFQFHSDGIPMASDKIESNCLVLTFGVLEDINEQPIICFRELKDLVNVQNFISDLYSLNANYKGPVSLVSPGGDFLIPGELTLDTKKLTFSFFKSSKEKKGGEFSLRDIEGYVSSSDGNFWNGNESDKPENCFTMKILNKQTIWCIVYYNTHLYPSKLNPRKFPTWSGQFYKYNWIARINNCIHLLNLNKSQKILLSHYKENSIISCSATILGAVLYEIRHKFSILKHKINQLIATNDLSLDQGLRTLNLSRMQIIEKTCISNKSCLESINICIEKGEMSFDREESSQPGSFNSSYNSEVNKINKDLIRKLILRREHRKYKLKYKARKTVPPKNEILRAVAMLNQVFSVDPEIAKKENLSLEYGSQLCRQLDENINQGRKLTGFLHLYSKTTDPQIDFLSQLGN